MNDGLGYKVSWPCFLGSWLKLTFNWKDNLFIFFRSSFKFFADRIILRATENRNVSSANSLGIETKLSERSLINIKKKRWPKIDLLGTPALTYACKEYWPFKMILCFLASTIPYKISETFLCFSIVSVHYKWNGARLLSPEGEWASCLTSCRTTY